MQGQCAIILLTLEFVQFIVEAEVEEEVDEQFTEVAGVPLQHTAQQHNEEGVGPDASIFVIV